MLKNLILERYNPTAQVSHLVQPAVVSTPPVVHIVRVINDQIYHADTTPNECLEIHDRMDDFQDQLLEMQKEMKSLRGK